MEQLLSAVVSDLLGRALSMVIHRYWQSKGAEEKLQRLQRLLVRIDAIVEEAEGRHITNQAMLQQLQMLRDGMYRGYFMLDTFRYRGHKDEAEDEVSGRSFALSRFNPPKRLFFSLGNRRNANMVLDAGSTKMLEKMLGSLERMIGDMEEFVMFLDSYPRICRQPYSTYLLLDKIMFGRQMETETIISFLLRREAVGNGILGVLPIIGAVRVGKSTLVEHVCVDERVRNRFASIVFFSANDLNGGNLASLRGSGIIKHQNLPPTSYGKFLVVIELAGDIDEETWRSYSSAVNHMAPGSKIIITSCSEKVAAFGTTQALQLKFLSQEAYWYFFKAIAFGSANPEDHPKLAALGMEIASLLNRSFGAANILASLLRGNLSAQFWHRVLKCVRDCTNKNILLFGEHPMALVQKGRPIYNWTLAGTQAVILIRSVYQHSSLRHGVPLTTTQDVMSGSTLIPQGKFEAVAWKSNIPPYHTYLASCVSMTSKCTTVSKKRSRQQRA